MLFLELSFICVKDRVNFNVLTVALFIVNQATQCIECSVQCFYLQRKKGPLVLFSTRDKRVAIKFHENQIINIGSQYQEDAT